MMKSDSWSSPFLPAMRTVFAGNALLVGIALVTDAPRRVDNLIYDFLLKLRPAPPREDVVIVAIDAESLSQLGRWPWPRTTHAALIDQLTQHGARVIALDLLLPEPDPTANGDLRLAAAIAAHGGTVLPVAPEAQGDGRELGATVPVPSLRQAAAKLGHVDTEIESDAVVRGAFLRGGINGESWSALALAMLEIEGLEPAPLPGELGARTMDARSSHPGAL